MKRKANVSSDVAPSNTQRDLSPGTGGVTTTSGAISGATSGANSGATSGTTSDDINLQNPPPPCSNPLVTPLLTDMYQLSMGLAYYRASTHQKSSTFELFFRKPPFSGEFCVFAGLDQVMSHLQNFKFSESQLLYIKELLPEADEGERRGKRRA